MSSDINTSLETEVSSEPRKPSRILRILVTLLKSALTLAFVLIISLAGLRLWLARTYTPGGKPPAGYSSLNQLYAAIIVGALPLIERQPAIPPEIQYTPGITYNQLGSTSLKLDLYQHKNNSATEKRPLFVLIHGGGWKSGQREDYRPHALKAAQAGYIVASLSYRLSGTAPFPAAVRDVNAALQFLADHADSYNINPQKIVVMGGSAGGHLAMCIGYSQNPDFKPESDPSFLPIRPTNQQPTPYKIAAIFNFYGPSDLSSNFARTVDVVQNFLGTSYEKNPEIYKQASPLFDITPSAPPTLIVHGSLDDIVPIEQSDELANALQKASVPVLYERLTGWPHTMDLAEPMFNYLSNLILDQLARHVGKPASAK